MSRILTASLVFAFTFSACSSQPLQVENVYSSGHCSEQEKALRLVRSDQELQQLARQPLKGATSLPEVDFDRQWVVLAAWGRQPNAGYRVTLVDGQAQREGDAVELPIAFEAPDPGTMQAQVMTAPCLVVAVSKGSYSRLEADGFSIEVGR